MEDISAAHSGGGANYHISRYRRSHCFGRVCGPGCGVHCNCPTSRSNQLRRDRSASMRFGDKHQHPAPSAADPDFYSVLLRVIDFTRNDPAYLRSLVYELARSKLYREAFVADMRMSEVREHQLALESAIDRVEAISQEESIQLGEGLVPTVYNLDEIKPEFKNSNPLSTRNKTLPLIEKRPQRSRYYLPGLKWFFAGPTLQMLGISVLVLTISIGLYTGVGGRFDLHRNSSSISDLERNLEATCHEAKQEVRNQLQTRPLPTNFGVYAVSDGQLNSLQPLRVKVPDQRVLIGPMITAPSQITLKDGNVSFIVYRRDLMFGVPDKVSVRVLARVRAFDDLQWWQTSYQQCGKRMGCSR